MNKIESFLIGVLVGAILVDYTHIRWNMIRSTRRAKKQATKPVNKSESKLKAIQTPYTLTHNPYKHVKPLSKLRLKKANNS